MEVIFVLAIFPDIEAADAYTDTLDETDIPYQTVVFNTEVATVQ